MEYLFWLVWLSPCLLPVFAVALLAILSLLRQARRDAQRPRNHG